MTPQQKEYIIQIKDLLKTIPIRSVFKMEENNSYKYKTYVNVQFFKNQLVDDENLIGGFIYSLISEQDFKIILDSIQFIKNTFIYD